MSEGSPLIPPSLPVSQSLISRCLIIRPLRTKPWLCSIPSGAATMAMVGPRFFGFVIGGVLPAALAANWLSSAWDQNAALAEVTPLPAKLEDVALGWLCDVFGLPAGTGVGFVTGATMVNFTCLAAARHAVL